MYNINADHNPELMKSCTSLREYANYLDGFFKRYRSEVYMNVLTDFDIKIYEDGLREEFGLK